MAETTTGAALERNQTLYPVLSINGRAMEWQKPLWEAIHAYVRACGGDPDRMGDTEARIASVNHTEAAVETAIHMTADILEAEAGRPDRRAGRGAHGVRHGADTRQVADGRMHRRAPLRRIMVSRHRAMPLRPHTGERGMSTTRDVEFWTCSAEQEHLAAQSIEEAVEEWADREYPNPLPETVVVFGFAPMELPSEERLADRVLEPLLESLDEEYSDPDGEPTKPSEAMKAAAREFARVVRSEYRVWTCEEVTRETVRVAEYLEAAAPQGAEREG